MSAPTVMVQIDNMAPVPGDLQVEQEWIDVSTITATKPDPQWEHIDQAGHFHAYDEKGELPTLATKVVHMRPEPDPDEDNDDGDDDYSYTVRICRICGEEIQPMQAWDDPNRFVPGRMTWTVTAQSPVDRGKQVTVRVRMKDRMAFGVGVVTSRGLVTFESGRSQPTATVTIVGEGPLGIRRATR